MKPRYLKDKEPWMIAEDIPELDFQFSQIWLSSFVNDLEKTAGKNYKKILSLHRGYKLTFYYGKKDSDEFGKHILSKLINDPRFGKDLNRNIKKHSDKLELISRKIEPKRLRKLNDERLSEFYQELDKLHTALYTYGWLPNAVDMFHANFTNYLKSLLIKKLPSAEVNSAMVYLSTSAEKSVFNSEHESLLKLAALRQKGVGIEKLKLEIQKHLSNFFHLKHLWLGTAGIYTESDIVKEINRFIKSGEKAKDLLKKEEIMLGTALAEKRKLLRKLKLSKKERDLFAVYAEFAITKAYRRNTQILWAYHMDFMFAELSKRLKLPLMQVRFMFPWEVEDSLKNGANKKLRAELKKRVKYCAYYAEKGVDLIFYGDKAKKFEKQAIGKKMAEVEELQGQTACLGHVKGVVRVVNIIADMKKMDKGDILVSIATNPDIVSAMKKAAAIVTEQGGITSHAAIASRELGTPCIIGTKIATKVLKDGDLIEVNANHGWVRKIK